jgi:hypothetical protein
MTTAELWRRMMGQIGWRITCPGCGKAHEIPARERIISSLYFAVMPGILSAGVLSRILIPIDRAQRGLLLAGLFVAFALLGSWFAARRLRLG